MSDLDNSEIRIVVVDDEEIVVSLVRDALEDEGYEIATANSAEQALGIIENQNINLIITDIRMPHMDGIEMVQRAREMRPNVVVIFMTGYANLNSAKDAIKQGAVEYILKPFELTEIRQAVTNAVEKIRRLAEESAPDESLERLSDLNQMLYTAGDSRSLATLSLRFALMHCDSERGAILFWNSKLEDFRLVSIDGDRTEERTVPEHPLADNVRAADPGGFARPFYVSSLEDHPLYVAGPDPALQEVLLPTWSRPAARLAVVPIRRADSLLGMIMVGFGGDDTGLKDHDLKFLSVTASQLALSLENIELLEEAQQAYASLKELQDETIQLEKMATRGEMSAEIGHELNNFLGVVAGNLSLLDFHLNKQDYDQLGRYVHAISDNVEKIKRFTGNLMDLTPISSSKETVDFGRMLREVVDYLKPQRRYREVTIDLHLDDIDMPFEADVTHIQQLLYNLFNNAADATMDRPERRITVGAAIQPPGDCFAMKIRDTGVGIEPDLLKKAFSEKFTTKSGGHGFGLLVCRRIIDAHGGKLEIDSTPGEGTCITITFPLAASTAPVPA